MTHSAALPALEIQWDVEFVLPADADWPADAGADDTVLRDVKTGFVWIA